MQAGDRIVKIDGKLTKGMSLMDAVKAIRGPVGTKVTLTVARENQPKLLDIPIVRGVIPLKSTAFFLLQDGYGYVAHQQLPGKHHGKPDQGPAQTAKPAHPPWRDWCLICATTRADF